jgi:hypothetical protein
MGLIQCGCCGRQRDLKPIPRKKFKCSNCGCRSPRIIRRVKVWMTFGDIPGLPIEEARRRTYAGLLWFAAQKHFKSGWPLMKYKTLFGVFPPRGLTPDPEPMSAGLSHWLDKQNAVYAQALRKKERALLAAVAPPLPVGLDVNGFIPGTLCTPEDLDVRL